MKAIQDQSISGVVVTTLIAIVALAAVPAAAIASTGAAAVTYDVSFHGNLNIVSFDNATILRADAFTPVPKNASERFPLVIFVNSWSIPQFEYILKALGWAETGYVCLEYETRGWWRSGGEIDTAGPLDRRDASAVLDWALSMADAWQIDVNRVAFAGISYGAGISLQMAGFDPRVTTVVAMSGWSNLTKALYGHHTPNTLWGDLLVFAADIVGHPMPELSAVFSDLVNHRNMSAVRAFAEKRGAVSYLDMINARKVPVFISNNVADMLFHPQDMGEFWSRLTGPKLLLLNQGGHAEAEILGLFDLGKNYVWSEAKLWIDAVLKDANNGIWQQQLVQIEQSGGGGARKNFDTFPDNSSATIYQTLYFVDRSAKTFGGLSTTPIGTQRSHISGSLPPLDSIGYVADTGLTLGIPLISNYLTPLVRPTVDLSLVSRSGAVVYESGVFVSSTTICGTPRYTVQFLPSNSSWQLFGFLYTVDILGIGTLQSHSYVSHYADDQATQHGATTIAARDDGQVTASGPFHTVCLVVPKGSKIAVGFSLSNDEYTPANTAVGVTFVYSQQTALVLPILSS